MALIVEIPGSVFTPLAPTQTGLCYVEEIVGTSGATAIGLTVGATTFTDPALINRCVEVHRNLLLLPGMPWGGGSYITKVFNYSFVTFSDALMDGELIKIKII